MKKIYIVFFSILFLIVSCAPKELYYLKDINPPQILCDASTQSTISYPPFLRPKGKRKTIPPESQYFTLAIPNCVDMSGRANDLQRSLADMLYTQLFDTGRFNLIDRGELTDLDPEWLSTSLKRLAAETVDQSSKSDVQDSLYENTQKYLDRKKAYHDEMISTLREKADGLLQSYITSRSIEDTSGKKDGSKSGGYFDLDYRIVSTSEHNIVLFAASQRIHYNSSTANEVEYNRDDIKAIADNIVRVFPNPNDIRKSEVVTVDKNRIVIDVGRNKMLIPGLMGYVVCLEDSIYTGDKVKAQHYSYLGKFIITEVYDQTSTGFLLPPHSIKNYMDLDIRVGDAAIIK
ncbi:MAG: hypothetical protein HQK76_05845 [Desulfobacterales bacterium]|nr:hypothetical protein [Desulfobacterales bacterium]